MEQYTDREETETMVSSAETRRF